MHQRLQREYKSMKEDSPQGIHVELCDDDISHWICYIEGPKDTFYEGGIFKLDFTFPNNYPMSPPKVKFLTKVYHPNVYENGEICISILHPPGDDPFGYESHSERWNPVLTVESVLLSIISLFNDPNIESPANIDASIVYRDNIELFKVRAKQCSQQAAESVPEEIKKELSKEKSNRSTLLSSGNYDYDYDDFEEDYVEEEDEEEYYDSDLS